MTTTPGGGPVVDRLRGTSTGIAEAAEIPCETVFKYSYPKTAGIVKKRVFIGPSKSGETFRRFKARAPF